LDLINSGPQPAYVDHIVDTQRIKTFDREQLLERLQVNPFSLEHAPDDLRDDAEVVLSAIRVNALALGCASDRLRNNRDLVEEAVNLNESALAFASDEILDDADFLIGLVGTKSKVRPLGFASSRLRADPVFVLKVTSHFGLEELRYADDTVWSDGDFVLEIVQRDPLLLKFASSELRARKDIVLAAAEVSQYAVIYADGGLKDDPDIIAAAGRAKARKKAKAPLRKGGRRPPGWEIVGTGEREG